VQVAGRGDGGVNPGCESEEVGIPRADHDPGVSRGLPVKANEVPTVLRQDDPVVGNGRGKNLVVGHLFPGEAAVRNRNHVVPEVPEFGDGFERKVLIGVQACRRYASSFSRISASISARFATTYAAAWTRCSAVRLG